jgi:hypothetical protein
MTEERERAGHPTRGQQVPADAAPELVAPPACDAPE